jgi:hypothetical protein
MALRRLVRAPVGDVTVPHELVVRTSTAPPPA